MSRFILAFLALIAVTSAFNVKYLTEPKQEGFTLQLSPFGDVSHFRESKDLEEVVLSETGNIHEDPIALKAAHDTILDVTKNPERQK